MRVARAQLDRLTALLGIRPDGTFRKVEVVADPMTRLYYANVDGTVHRFSYEIVEDGAWAHIRDYMDAYDGFPTEPIRPPVQPLEPFVEVKVKVNTLSRKRHIRFRGSNGP